jgi:hypothetical protein
VIIGIFVAAVSAAAASWLFRYNATHRATEFWGPEAAQLIRDAPVVEFSELEHVQDADGELTRIASAGDVTSSPGLTHLRNALLEDRSFEWPPEAPNGEQQWKYSLWFRRLAGQSTDNTDDVDLVIWFSNDFHWAEKVLPGAVTDRVISVQPISKGLRKMFDEFIQMRSSASGGDAAR